MLVKAKSIVFFSSRLPELLNAVNFKSILYINFEARAFIFDIENEEFSKLNDSIKNYFEILKETQVVTLSPFGDNHG